MAEKLGSIDDFASKTEAEISAMPGIGAVSKSEIIEAVQARGLTLRYKN